MRSLRDRWRRQGVGPFGVVNIASNPDALAWRGRLAVVARGALLLALAVLPATATAPPHGVTAVAPVEVWADGLGDLRGVAVDAADGVLVADRAAGTVIRIAPDQSRVIVASGLEHPTGLAVDARGRLLIAEERAGRVVRVEGDGTRTPLVTGLERPRWLAVGETGTLYVSARRPGRGEAPEADDDASDAETIVARSTDGRLTVFAGGFRGLEGLAASGDSVWAATEGRRGERRSDVVYRIAVLSDGSAGALAEAGARDAVRKPRGVARDRLGALLVTAKERRAVAKVSPLGVASDFADGLADPQGLALDAQGHLYVADGHAGRVLRFRAPSRPALTVPAVTARSPLTVSGITEPNARVDVFADGRPIAGSVLATSAGGFAVPVALTPNATTGLRVFATARGGDGLTSAPATASVLHDGTAPSLAFRAPAAGAFVAGTVTVQIEASDAGDVDTLGLVAAGQPLAAASAPALPAATTVATAAWTTAGLADGSYTLGATASDRAGNTQTATRVIIVDNTPPETTITSAPRGDVADRDVVVTFTGADNLTPVTRLRFAWRLDGGAWSAFGSAATAAVRGLGDGAHVVEVKARDLAGNDDPTPATAAFTVTPGPAIAGVDPPAGRIGDFVTITGARFVPGATRVAFGGAGAVVRTVTPTTITTTVPPGATTGPLTVTTAQGAASAPYTITPAEDFAVQVAPVAAQVLQGATTTYAVTLLGPEAGTFTGLATLAVTGLPAGVTAAFAPAATLTGGQVGTLAVTAATDAPAGIGALTLTATATDAGPAVRTARVTLEVQPGGRTAVLGRITLVDGTPLAGVRLNLAGQAAVSDAGGNFQLVDVPAGTQMLGVDANAAQAGLPIYAVEVALAAGRATTLPPLRITPPPPPDRFVPIANATADQQVTDARYPGLSVTLPAGVTITGWDGTPKTRIALGRLSPDALPIPPPPGETRALYQIFFGTPMGGVPSGRLPVTVPNDQDLRPGEKAEIWYYDAAPLPGVPAAWRRAGLGTVSDDGTRVVSDPGVGLERFCGVCGTFCILKNILGKTTRNVRSPLAGDPVDLALGQMIVSHTDLVLPGRMAATVHRTYSPFDPFGGVAGFALSTGPGWALATDVVLLEESPSLRQLILPGNARIAFARTADGGFTNTTDQDFAGAVLTAEPGGAHRLRFKDGTAWRFVSGWLPRGRPLPLAGLGLLVERRDRNGNTVTITRDANGGVTRLTEPAGRALTFTTTLLVAGDPTSARLTAVTDPLGRTVRYGYDAVTWRLATVTDAAGGVTRYAYDAAGRIVSITDPRGVTSLTSAHDAQGRVVRQTQADGGVWTFAYEGPAGAHTRVTVTDPGGHATTHRMDSAGLLVETVDALGQTTRTDRDAAGHPVAVTDPLGRVTRYAYDGAGNVTAVTDAAGHVRTFTYEATFNRMTSLRDELGNTTRFEYDGAGNLTAAVDPLGHRTTIAYNAYGQPAEILDPVQNRVTFGYDGRGYRTALADTVGATTLRTFDDAGRVVERVDPLGRRSTFGYDALDRLTTITDALGGTTTMTYDPNGNLLTVTDPAGNVTAHAFDPMNRAVSRTDPGGRVETFRYDASGRLTSATDRNGALTTHVHDALNRTIATTYADGTSVRADYDAAGRLTRVLDSAAGVTEWAFDAIDRVVAEITARGTVGYRYDAAHRRIETQLPGQPPIAYEYDAAARLLAITQGTERVTIDHDPGGRRTRLLLPNRVATEYRYDATSRVTALTYRAPAGLLGDLTYDYDAAGNVIGVGGSLARTLHPAPVTGATYGAGHRQLGFDALAMTYDDNGDLTSVTDGGGTTSFTWDPRQRLVAIDGPATSARFVYDALGRRIAKTVDQTTIEYVYDGGDVVQELTGNGAVSYLRAPWADEPLRRGDTEYYLVSAPGSVLALTDAAAAVATTYTYDPFGQAVRDGGPTANPFAYTAREDDGTGLYHYRARFYSPALHRFISEDPIGFAGGAPNLYSYVHDNPMGFTDPSGLDAINWRPTPNRSVWLHGPRNGNWGGGRWSGGRTPGNSGAPAPPTDSGDECYMRHDLCFDACGVCPGRAKACVGTCNSDLVQCLTNLPSDPGQWPRPPRPGTAFASKLYRLGAIVYFSAPNNGYRDAFTTLLP